MDKTSKDIVFFIMSVSSRTEEECKKERKDLFGLEDEENNQYVIAKGLEEDSDTLYYMIPYIYAKKIDTLILNGKLKDKVFVTTYDETGIKEINPYEVNKKYLKNIFKKFKDINNLTTVLSDEISEIPQGFSSILIGQQMAMIGASQNISNSMNANKEKFSISQHKLDDIEKSVKDKKIYKDYVNLIEDYNSNNLKLSEKIDKVKDGYYYSKNKHIASKIDEYKSLIEEEYDNKNLGNLETEINDVIKQNDREQDEKLEKINKLEDTLVSEITTKLKDTDDFPNEVISIYTDSYKFYRQKSLLLNEIEKTTGIHVSEKLSEQPLTTTIYEENNENIDSDNTEQVEENNENIDSDNTEQVEENNENIDSDNTIFEFSEGEFLDVFFDEDNKLLLENDKDKKDELQESNIEYIEDELKEIREKNKEHFKDFNISKRTKIIVGLTVATLTLATASVLGFNFMTNQTTKVVDTKTTAESSVSYLLSNEEYEDYLERLSKIDGIYLNSDGSLGGSLYFSDGTTRRIKEFTRNGEIVLRAENDLNEVTYSKASVDGLLARLESGTKTSDSTNKEKEEKTSDKNK